MGSQGYGRGDRQGLIHAYDEEEGLGLTDLTEDSDDDDHPPRSANGKINGNGKASEPKRSFGEPAEVQRTKSPG